MPTGRELVVEKAEGVWLHTAGGHKVLDAAAGAIVAGIGHGRADVAEVYAKAVQDVTYAVPPFVTPQRNALMEKLQSGWLPDGMTRGVMSSGGSESMETALRLAREYQIAVGQETRWKFIGRDISYHGATFMTMDVGGHIARKNGLEPYAAGHPKVSTPYKLRHGANLSDEAYGQKLAEELNQCIEVEGSETVAAFIAEPFTGSSGGVLTPPANYWSLIREVCDRHGVVLIADEVMTGYGRTGETFAVKHFNVIPDILVGGKGLACGYAPIGGTFCSPAMTDALQAAGRSIMFFTYGGHPASCAAATKVLEIMENERLVSRVQEMAPYFEEKLRRLENHPHVAEVRGKGFLWGVELVRDKETLEPFAQELGLTMKVTGQCIRRGVFVYGGGTGVVRDIINLGPPFIIERREIDLIVDVLEESIDAALA